VFFSLFYLTELVEIVLVSALPLIYNLLYTSLYVLYARGEIT